MAYNKQTWRNNELPVIGQTPINADRLNHMEQGILDAHTGNLTTQERDKLAGIEAGATRMVASRHHQALGRLGRGVVVCVTTKDGIVEAAKVGERHFGMQWHPESDLTGVHMYRAFVERCMME